MNKEILKQLIKRHPGLNEVEDVIWQTAKAIIGCYKKGGKLLLCGNGGSSSDAGHIVGELMKSFESFRPVGEPFKTDLERVDPERGSFLASRLEKGLQAISLNAHGELFSAISNDIGADLVFAQQVYAYGLPGDVLIGISTSGNSRNVVDALITAKAKGLTTIGLTGESGGKMRKYCDLLINIPGTSTAAVQELQLPVYHTVCRIVERHFFPELKHK